MNAYRRSIPRSVRRTPTVKQEFTPAHDNSIFSKSEISPERYVPDFNRRGRDSMFSYASEQPFEKIEPEQVQSSRFKMELCSAPLTCVRWLPGGGRAAIVAVGSGGGDGEDFISFYSVTKDISYLHSDETNQLKHQGKVMKLAVSERDELIYSASSDGGIRAVKIDNIEDRNLELNEIAHTSKTSQNLERVTAIAAMDKTAVATGDQGTVFIVDVESGIKDIIAQADDAGFRDVACADEGAKGMVTAGSADVAVWDIRSQKSIGLPCSQIDYPTCVAVDAGQPHFVMAGFQSGSIRIWDQRGTSDTPINDVAVHQGPVWDIGVVSCNKPGILLSCGEDGRACLLDFSTAASRVGVESTAQSWYNQGEFWRATLSVNDARDTQNRQVYAGINSVNAHTSADLFAYTTDSGYVEFSSLFS